MAKIKRPQIWQQKARETLFLSLTDLLRLRCSKLHFMLAIAAECLKKKFDSASPPLTSIALNRQI